jgi:hypothetical protein
MNVELLHHYGWKLHQTNADNLHDAAKAAVRESHEFLTDTNHTMDARERTTTWGGKELRYHSALVFRGEGAPAYSGPAPFETSYWFAVQYRAADGMSRGESNG